MKRFEVFHQRCLRRILKIRWQQHIRNEQARLQKADRAEKATEEVKASKANALKFGADVHVFKPPVSK